MLPFEELPYCPWTLFHTVVQQFKTLQETLLAPCQAQVSCRCGCQCLVEALL